VAAGGAAVGAGVGAGAAGRGVGAGLAGVLRTGPISVFGLLTTRGVDRRGAELAGAGVEAGLPLFSSSGVEVAVGSALVALLTGTLAFACFGFLAGFLAAVFGAAVAVAAGAATAAWSLAIASASLRSEIGAGGELR
jgi:hypothetical protein